MRLAVLILSLFLSVAFPAAYAPAQEAQEVPPSEGIDPIPDAGETPVPMPVQDTSSIPKLAIKQADVGEARPAKDGAPDQKPDDEPQPVYNTVVLHGLNKVTGHTSTIEGPLNTDLKFGKLEINVHRCWKSSPDERPENAALMEIKEILPEGPKQIFLGWMFSSSPGLSGLEHAVYDINMLSCEFREPAKKETPQTKADSGKKTEKPEKKEGVGKKSPKSSKKSAAKVVKIEDGAAAKHDGKPAAGTAQKSSPKPDAQ